MAIVSVSYWQRIGFVSVISTNTKPHKQEKLEEEITPRTTTESGARLLGDVESLFGALSVVEIIAEWVATEMTQILT